MAALTDTHTRFGGRDPDRPSQETAQVVIRAGQRGFCRSRVATALGVSLRGLAVIDALAGKRR